MPSSPLSPHISIYRPMLTMMMSIAHRITGIALYGGTLLFTLYLAALASGKNTYAYAQTLIENPLGQIALFLLSWALFHHMLGGLRHFLWDAGYGFGLKTIEWLARLTLAGGLLIAALLWLGAWLL